MIRTKIVGGGALQGILAAAISGQPDMVVVESRPHVTVVVGGLGMSDSDPGPWLMVGASEDRSLLAAIERGAMGYVGDDQPVSSVVEVVRTLAAGGASVPDSMLGVVLAHVVRRRRVTEEHRERFALLTEREREVFEAAARGLGKEEIGELLFMSPETARTHISRLYKKLGIGSRAGLVAFAAELGYETTREDL